ncbi:endoribonuclease L-PSP [Peptoniphilus sp. ING2-D1G]|nr:endoribonuclease L-PSP [Peptoniphilus sp. ING2-D1G]
MEKNPIPQGKYIPAKKSANFIFSAGMTPRLDGKLIQEGKVERDKPLEDYKDAVVQAAKNAITAIKNTLVEDEEIEAIMTMTVYINAEDDFTSHSKLADFASEYIVNELGDIAICSRTAIGVKSLPGRAPVEIQIIASYK